MLVCATISCAMWSAAVCCCTLWIDVYKRQNLSRAALVPAAFCEGRHDLLAIATEDKLHQQYRLSLIHI